MAVSDAFLAIILAQLAIFLVLYLNKQRIWRMVGSVALVVVGASSVMIDDSVPMLIFFLISALIGGIKLFEEVSYLGQ